MQKEGRIGSIDILRTLAIILVVSFHAVYEFTNINWWRNVGMVGISLFFILSGYILAKKYPSQERFTFKWIIKRYIKIAVLYYLALIMIVLLFAKQVYFGNVFKNLFLHFIFLDFLSYETVYGIISAAWFLIPLLGLYVLYPYLNKFLKNYPWILLVIFIISTYYRIDNGTFTSFNPIFFMGEFCFGILFAHNNKNPFLISALLISVADPVMILSFFFFYLVCQFSIKLPFPKIFEFIGRNTLSLFLFHEAYIKIIVGKWRIYGFDKICSIIVLTIATMLTVYFAEKIKGYLCKKYFNNKPIKFKSKGKHK